MFCVFDLALTVESSLIEVAIVAFAALKDFDEASAIEFAIFVVSWVKGNVPVNLYLLDEKVQFEITVSSKNPWTVVLFLMMRVPCP